MKIKTKLSLGFLTLIVVVCAVASIGILVLSDTFEKLNGVVNDEYKKIGLISDMRFEFNNKAKGLSYLIIAESETEKEREITNIRAAGDRGLTSLEELGRIVETEQGRILLADISRNQEEFADFIEEEILLIEENRIEEAADLNRKEGKVIQEKFFDSIFNLVEYYELDMDAVIADTGSQYKRTSLTLIILSIVGITLGVLISILITRSIVNGLKQVSSVMCDFSSGKSKMSTRIKVEKDDEIGSLSSSFNNMAEALESQVERELKISQKNEEQAWMTKNLADLTAYLQSSSDLESFANHFIQKITPLVDGKHGVFYIQEEKDGQPTFNLAGAYAYKQQNGMPTSFRLGEGFVGQSALSKKVLVMTDVPDDYIRISSGTGEAKPKQIIVVPIIFEDQVRAVYEIASFEPIRSIEQELLVKLADYSGIIIDNICGRIKIMEMLEESQTMTEELQTQSEELSTQHEELKRFNDELEKQTKALLESEINLQQQHEELEQSNAELEEKAVLLEEHNQKFETKNREVEQAKLELEEKATQLELTSKYKSEFLANMSHELRTPLNSLLILSKLLADNKLSNLSEKQVEYAKTINSAGCDLLDLINDILDLSKIESGKTDIHVSEVEIREVSDYVEKYFNPIAHDKGLLFDVQLKVEEDTTIQTDEKILQQILKNLIANAIKFTEQGSVNLIISKVTNPVGVVDILGRNNDAEEYLAFHIVDTGIGIPKNKQSIIFEAFQQADGTTSRKYGGTGLGLSISREQASLLSGSIVVESEEGQGSTFTLYLPFNTEPQQQEAEKEVAITSEEVELLPMRVDTKKHGKRILIVEDNYVQRESMMELIQGNYRNVDMVAVSTGKDALDKLQVEHFNCMILDLRLEDMAGIELLNKVRNMSNYKNFLILIYTGKELTIREEMELKHFTETIIVKGTQSHERLLDEISLFIRQLEEKPPEESKPNASVFKDSKKEFFEDKKILIVDDDVRNVFALSSILEEYEMDVLFAENGKEALDVLKEHENIDLVLMDIMMPVMDGFEAITKIREMEQYANLPIIALTAKAMKEDREKCLEVGASDYISKPIINHQLISLMRVWLYR